MNGIIKYRGMHIHATDVNKKFDGTWIYGYLIDKNYIRQDDYFGEMLVSEETICIGVQLPGGEWVYTGDYIECRKHDPYEGIVHRGEVTFRNGCFWFGNWNWIEFLNIMRGCKIIGNKFDNPELLEAIK